MGYFEHKLIVDGFCGGGGASTGIEWALGRPVDLAFNHAWDAIGMHMLNHPFTKHLKTDVFDVVPWEILKGQKVALAHFSPDCTHHSKAKGGKPVSKKIRGLALVMLRWAKYGTEVITMENVEEMKDWGPLVEMVKKGKPGLYPDPQQKGRTWKAFIACLTTGIDPEHPDLPEFLEVLGGTVTKEELVRGFGYAVETRELRGSSYDTPTIRNRLFMVARCDGRPIVWPEATHGDPKKLKPGQETWRTIAECLDFSLACPSIFLTRKQAKALGVKRPLVKNTLRRVAVGVGKFVIHAKEPFIVNTSNGNNHAAPSRVRGCDEPMPPQTGVQKFAVVEPSMAPFVTDQAHTTAPRSHAADEPMRAHCAGVKRGHLGLVSGTLVQTGYGERVGQEPRAMDLRKPGWTNVAGGGKAALAAVSTVKLRGKNIGTPVSKPGTTASAQGQHHGLVATSLVRHFGQSVGSEADGPAPTVMPDGQGKTGLLSVHMAQHNGGFNEVVGRAADEPVSALTGTGSQQQLVATSMAAYYKSGSVGQATDRPLRTGTTKARLCHVESHAVYPNLTPQQLAGARRVAKFLRSFGVEFEGEFATVQGHVIVDIGMRMLTPRELYRAQGFGDDYVIDRAWTVDPKTGKTREVKLTKEQQIRMCGNSVCPPVMRALVRANVPYLIQPHPPKKWRPSLELMKAAKLVA